MILSLMWWDISKFLNTLLTGYLVWLATFPSARGLKLLKISAGTSFPMTGQQRLDTENTCILVTNQQGVSKHTDFFLDIFPVSNLWLVHFPLLISDLVMLGSEMMVIVTPSPSDMLDLLRGWAGGWFPCALCSVLFVLTRTGLWCLHSVKTPEVYCAPLSASFVFTSSHWRQVCPLFWRLCDFETKLPGTQTFRTTLPSQCEPERLWLPIRDAFCLDVDWTAAALCAAPGQRWPHSLPPVSFPVSLHI